MRAALAFACVLGVGVSLADEPADHAMVAVAVRGGASIFLSAGRFACPEAQRRAVLVTEHGSVWLGCWAKTEDGKTVHIDWEDGDKIDIPVAKDDEKVKGLSA